MPYVIAGGAAVLVVLLTWFTLDETLSPEQREANRSFNKSSINPREIVRNMPLMLILIVAFVGQFGMGLLQATFSLYGEAVLFEGYSEKMATLGIGLLLTTVGIGQFFTQAVLLRRALKRFDEAWLVLIGVAVRSVALFTFAALAIPVAGAFASLLFAVGMGLMMPSLQSLSTNTVADELRGGVLGVYQSTISLSTIVSTAISGIIFAMNATAPFWIGGVLTVLVLIPAFMLIRQTGARVHFSQVPVAPLE
jgi:MFS family permease